MSQLFSGVNLVDANGTFKPKNASEAAITIIGLANQSEDLLIIKNSSNTELLSIGTTGAFQGVSGQHLFLNTVSDDKQVRINSRNYAQASGSSIGFQSKPAQNATTTGSVIGGEISPRLNNTFNAANVIGLHVDAYLKGTAAKTISGDVRGQQIELVTDDAGTNTVSGNVTGLRFRAAFSASTLTGAMEAIRIEKAETQTNSQQWDYVLTLTGDNGLIWRDDYTTEVTTIAGAIKVLVNGADRWIPLYSGAPSV